MDKQQSGLRVRGGGSNDSFCPGQVDPAGLSARAQSAEIIQMSGDGHDHIGPDRIRTAAAAGLVGSGGSYPHARAIGAAFGPRYPIDSIAAHIDTAAQEACATMGAAAFTAGERVAFAEAPSLRLAAHEAAHVVQQRLGQRPSGGIGRPGDVLERQADQVAEVVTAGQSAEPLLESLSAGPLESGAEGGAIQMSNGGNQQTGAPPVPHHDVGSVLNGRNIRIGDLCDEGTGRRVMQNLSAGRLDALLPVNGPRLPATFPPNNVEWGLGRLNGRRDCCVIRGQEGPPPAVDWGRVPTVTGIAHSHPNANRIEPINGSTRIHDILNRAYNNVGFLPSTSDLRHADRNGDHTLYTPFHYLGDGIVGNPSPGAPQPTIEIHMTNARCIGRSAQLSDEVFHCNARIVAGQETLATGQIWALYLDRSPTFEADMTHFGSSPPPWARTQ